MQNVQTEANMTEQLYAFVGELFMREGVESVARSYGIDESTDWADVMDQAVAIEMQCWVS